MARVRWGIAVALLVGEALGGEAAAPSEPATLDELIVTATRRELKLFDAPYMAEVYDQQFIQNRQMPRTPADILSENPSILVQKTSSAQGSPYLRGFTGFRTLFLIDGVRLNNSTFRDGPNQYWNTVDPLTIRRLEVVKGPSSVLYGSDAIGGTVNALTRGCEEFPDGFNWSRRIYYRYSTADRGSVGRAEIRGNVGHKLGFLLGMSLADYNDLEAGEGTGRQPKTGFDLRSCDLRLDFHLDPESTLTFVHQCHRTDDAWRAHKTVYGVSWHGTTVGDEKARVLDQERELAYLQFHTTALHGLFDDLKLTLSYQEQREDQFRIKKDDTSDTQSFTCRTLGLSAQLQNDTPIGMLTYGAELYHDRVGSSLRKYKADGSLKSIAIQGPVADDATYDLFGLYLQNEFPILKDLDAILGIRYTHARADADSVQDPDTGDRIAIEDSWDNVVGSARLVYHAGDHWNPFGGVSQGFRAPNLSDLTRLDTARSSEIETPSPGLSPEKFLACELGVKASYERWNAQFAGYCTHIRDLIIRYPTGVLIEGNREVQKANAGDGCVRGIEFHGDYRLTRLWSLFGGVAWQWGEADTYPASEKIKARRPMSRIAPLSAVAGARCQIDNGRFWFEALARMADRQDRLSPEDEADTQRIPPGGTPGYAVFDLRGGMRVSQRLSITAALENLLDKDYRIHGSGQNEPGRNLVLAVDWAF